MASVISNISGNIPVKARLMIVLTLVVVLSVAFVSISRITGDKEVISEGGADIALPPNSTEIGKDSPLDKPLYSDESEVGKIYRDQEKKAAEEASAPNSGKSHLDALRIRLEAEEKTKEEPEPVEPVKTDLQKLLEERRAQQESRRVEQQASVSQNQAVVQNNPWQLYIDQEKNFAKNYVSAYGQAIDDLKMQKLRVGKPLVDSSNEGSNRNAAQNGQQQVAAPSGYQRYLAEATQSKERAGSQIDQSSQPTQEYVEEDYQEDEQDFASYDYPSERLAAMTQSKDVAAAKILPGEAFYSVLQIGVNTDEISPIRLVIVEKGPLEGGLLVGKPSRVGEKAVLVFDRLSIKGESYTVNAIALDPDSMRTGIADGVDRHTVERYSKLFAASFIEGFASSLTGGQTTTNADGSSSTIVDALPNASDQALVGLGKVGERFAPIFEREFDRPPTVTVEPNKTVVLMFMEELKLKKVN